MRDPQRIVPILAVALCAALTLFLFLQPGSSIDEGEHLHVAWLMAARGLHPVRDFFEHHTPLFWHVLGFFYRAGASGPEVLYAARLLVIACAAIWCWVLVHLSRTWSAGLKPAPGIFAVSAFASIALLTPELIVARPETLSLALFGGALIGWTARRAQAASAAAAGALAMWAALCSPRFALLVPLLLLCTRDAAPSWPSARRAIAAAAGAAAAFAMFVVVLCPLDELLFDVRFSQVLQSIPLRLSLDLRFLSLPIAVAGLLGGVVWTLGDPPLRSALAWTGAGLFLCFACAISAGDYLYPQGFAPVLAWLSLFVAWLEARPFKGPDRAVLATIVVSTMLAVGVVQLLWAARSPQNVAGLTASRRLLLDAVPRGERVLLHPAYHPLTIEDASYWGSMLIDGPPGRGCEAAEIYRARNPSAALAPQPCDFIRDLQQNRPFAVHRTLALAAQPDRFEAVSFAVQRGWTLSDALNDAPMGSFAGNVLLRK